MGANGGVGRELCFMLRAAGHQVWPVVRNPWGAAYLRHQGFDVRVEDAGGVEEEAQRALSGAELVIISAFASTGSSRNEITQTNRRIIANAVRFSEPSACVVSFSSLRALSHEVDPATPRMPPKPVYDAVKRAGEKHFRIACERHQRKGFALRMGHVIGFRQGKTDKVRRLMAGSRKLVLAVDGNSPSNMLHTATIAEAVVRCARLPQQFGLHSLVNVPQWSWCELFEQYNDGGVQLSFQPLVPPSRTVTSQLAETASAVLRASRRWLAPARHLVPDRLADRHKIHTGNRAAAADLAGLQTEERAVSLTEFAYVRMPGPFIDGLGPTRDAVAAVADLFPSPAGTGLLKTDAGAPRRITSKR